VHVCPPFFSFAQVNASLPLILPTLMTKSDNDMLTCSKEGQWCKVELRRANVQLEIKVGAELYIARAKNKEFAGAAAEVPHRQQRVHATS